MEKMKPENQEGELSVEKLDTLINQLDQFHELDMMAADIRIEAQKLRREILGERQGTPPYEEEKDRLFEALAKLNKKLERLPDSFNI